MHDKVKDVVVVVAEIETLWASRPFVAYSTADKQRGQLFSDVCCCS